ncbi:hypothetical protein [Streptomyces anulatus]|uniref:hypothetical protein n=1 Tax=Streptomyces anulatus TaxID=1892 RepID=UPI00365DEBC1
MSTDTAVDHGILFYPRGGSSLAVKNLTEQTLAAARPESSPAPWGSGARTPTPPPSTTACR